MSKILESTTQIISAVFNGKIPISYNDKTAKSDNDAIVNVIDAVYRKLVELEKEHKPQGWS